MARLNYFHGLCLFWALLGIGSRILMGVFQQRWIAWEMERAYGPQKPGWLFFVSLAGWGVIAYTWYAVFTTDIAYDWILAVFVSFTGVKIFILLFRYDKFRFFLSGMLSDRKKMLWLNVSVLLFSLACVGMALFVY